MKKAFFQMHFAIFLWGFTGIFGRLISMPEYPLVWWRILITLIALGLFLKWEGALAPPSRRELKKIGLVGVLIAAHWVFFYGSIKYSNVSIALSALASTAMFTALMNPLLTNKRLRWSELWLGLLTIAGIYLIFRFQKIYTVGIILGLISAVLCSYFTIRNKELLESHGSRNLLFYELLFGFGALTVLAPLYLHLFPQGLFVPAMNDLGYLFLLSVVCTVYAMQLSYEALKHVSSFALNISVNLEPVYSIILAAFIFSEYRELNMGFYLGAAMIILSVAGNGLLSARNFRRPRK